MQPDACSKTGVESTESRARRAGRGGQGAGSRVRGAGCGEQGPEGRVRRAGQGRAGRAGSGEQGTGCGGQGVEGRARRAGSSRVWRQGPGGQGRMRGRGRARRAGSGEQGPESRVQRAGPGGQDAEGRARRAGPGEQDPRERVAGAPPSGGPGPLAGTPVTTLRGAGGRGDPIVPVVSRGGHGARGPPQAKRSSVGREALEPGPLRPGSCGGGRSARPGAPPGGAGCRLQGARGPGAPLGQVAPAAATPGASAVQTMEHGRPERRRRSPATPAMGFNLHPNAVAWGGCVHASPAVPGAGDPQGVRALGAAQDPTLHLPQRTGQLCGGQAKMPTAEKRKKGLPSDCAQGNNPVFEFVCDDLCVDKGTHTRLLAFCWRREGRPP